jgi:hypothetical protein
MAMIVTTNSCFADSTIIFDYCLDMKKTDNDERENMSIYTLCFKSIKIHFKIVSKTFFFISVSISSAMSKHDYISYISTSSILNAN